MNLEDKVVSLDWAKKLKACGFPQETEFSWGNNNGIWLLDETEIIKGELEYIAAPLPCEIADRLPFGYHVRKLYIAPNHVVGYVCFHDNNYLYFNDGDKFMCDKSLANALAAMYCYLDEKKSLKQGG